MVWAKVDSRLCGGIGALDFAVARSYISSGVSALVAAIVIGPRRSYPSPPTASQRTFILLGAGLHCGWSGFNAGVHWLPRSGDSGFVATTAAGGDLNLAHPGISFAR